MVEENLTEKLDYDEETLKDKIKKRTGILTLIGTGILSILHVLSHIIPAVGVLGLSFISETSKTYQILSSEYLQIAYVGFVVLSFWYIYRDHKHHEHERELRKQLSEAREELERLKKK